MVEHVTAQLAAPTGALVINKRKSDSTFTGVGHTVLAAVGASGSLQALSVNLSQERRP